MRISLFDTLSAARGEITRLTGLLDIPEGMTYGEPFEYNGRYAIKLKAEGTWKCDHLARGDQEDYVGPTP